MTKHKITIIKEHQDLLKENKEIIEKWCAALRSGKYVQVHDCMAIREIENSACCLHVLEMECNGVEWERGFARAWPSIMHGEHLRLSTGLLPEKIEAFVINPFGETIETYTTPEEWNDSLKLDFFQIADLLEKGELEYEIS